jgi:glycosyltransferase involved in cell wall biosynthesis
MRVIALLAVYNEERFIVPCLAHLERQGILTYLIDNESTDKTVELARGFTGRGLVGIETFPRRGVYSWRPLLERKERLAAELEADWFMHLDADELRLSPYPGLSLAEALAETDREGFNAVNFLEYTFVPTRESPDHDHPDYVRTMRWYYPYSPTYPNQVKAWKRQADPVDLVSSAGHLAAFPGRRLNPTPFPMKHYLFLSVDHALRKYVHRLYDPEDLARGWHRSRAGLRDREIILQAESELRNYVSDDLLDPSNPLTKHPLFCG